MNKILSILAIMAGASMLTGCDDYSERYEADYASVMRLAAYGEQKVTVWSTDMQQPYEVKVLRSGYDIASPTNVSLKVMSDDEWTSYANTYGIQRYYKLPDDCFRFDDAQENDAVTLDFKANQISMKTTLSLISAKVGAYSKTLPPPIHEGSEWANVICLPMILDSDDSSIYGEQKVLLLLVNYQQPTLELSSTGFSKVVCTTSQEPYVFNYTLTLPGENKWGFTVKVKNDAELLNQYNQANETNYTLMQPGALEVYADGVWEDWSDQTLEFPVGINAVSFRVRVNPAKVGLMDAMALNVTDPSMDIKLESEDVTSIFAIAVKPSGVRLKATATHSDYDGSHPASNLVDGRTDTYYQSQMTAHDGDPVYGSYVDFKLPKAIQYFSIDYVSRVSGFRQESVPNEVDIYVSANGTDWTLCSKIKNLQKDVIKSSQTVNYGNYNAGSQINYIRWAVVKGGVNGEEDLRGQNITTNWTATSINIYGK
ncbi:MAG: DUF1735 domain-containing protein [Muribaculaceae bacterium]|nr:DUF1735 domain-containing protein [Muribaculaceae bacterium]